MKIKNSDHSASVQIQISLITENIPQTGDTVVHVTAVGSDGKPLKHYESFLCAINRGGSAVLQQWFADHISELSTLAHKEAKAKEARRLAGIEKRRGPRKTLAESIEQSKNDGTYWRRNREGKAEQSKWDAEHGIERKCGFYMPL
jgi:hypothetical protein